jgi:CRISPR-associated protein Cst2
MEFIIMKTPIASLSIAARATLDMHSLNNEGGEGNQIQTRMVDIVDHLGDLHNVNAISGDMLKHVLMEHYHQQARMHHLPLCEGCKRFNVNRINFDDKFLKSASKKDFEFINQTLQTCAMDDVAGFLVTEGRSTPRKSVSEFGWVLGIPGKVRTDSYFHVKYASERGEEKRIQDAEDQKSGANRGQNIFHRPASSGIYAIVCHLEIARIGYNDISQSYAIGEEERQQRTSILLESIFHTFIELNGAMRSTQLPHLVAIEGVITTSTSTIPAPLISPLIGGGGDDKTYRQQVKDIASALNGSAGESVKVQNFDTISDFATQMRDLIDSRSPFILVAGR